MKQVPQIITTILVLITPIVAFSQSKAIREFSPGEKAILNQSDQEHILATQFLRAGKPKEALAHISLSIDIRKGLKPLDMPGDYYLLAQCQNALGRTDKALAAYRNCFQWNKAAGDLESRVAETVSAATDYAVLLARSNRMDDAKGMYYYALRNLNMNGEMSAEPYPLAVVFDPCPKADVWPYSANRLEAACLMVKAIGVSGGDDYMSWVQRASDLAPDWLYPVLYQGFRRYTGTPPTAFVRARAMAKTADQRALVERVADYDRHNMPPSVPDPAEFRKGLGDPGHVQDGSGQDLFATGRRNTGLIWKRGTSPAFPFERPSLAVH